MADKEMYKNLADNRFEAELAAGYDRKIRDILRRSRKLEYRRTRYLSSKICRRPGMEWDLLTDSPGKE
jgi:hypothetical protein